MITSLKLEFGDLVIDLERYQVMLSGTPVILKYREYALLVYLATRLGQVVPRRQLLEEGLGRHDHEGLRLVDEHIRHLKGLIEVGKMTFIEEVPDVGYKFNPTPGLDVTSN